MKRRRVRFTATARQHVQAAKKWWFENASRPDACVQELEEAIDLIALLPGAGSNYTKTRLDGVRRIYLDLASSHVYYTHTDEEVIVRAYWHAMRGRGPTIK